MQDDPLLIDIAIILIAAFPLLFLGRRFRIPEVVSYLAVGVIIGPHALGWIYDPARIEVIAELGVALILFFIGLHVPLGRLRALGRTTFLAGPLQMLFTAGAVAAVVMVFGEPLRQGLFYGLLIALGSTAVVVPILTSRDEMGIPYARRFLGVSLFQDLAVIPLILLVPAFAPAGDDVPPLQSIFIRVLVAVGAVVALMLIARVVVPRLFGAIARLGSREAFTAAAVVLIVGTIAIAHRIGISPALGAFAAGVVIGDTDFIHEIEGVLRPFRDFLSALFFTSIGMLLDPAFIGREPFLVAGVAIGVVVLKVLASYPAFRLSPAMKRTSVRAAFAMAPVGEFSFLLAQSGKRAGLLNADREQMFVAVAVLTLGATPLLLNAGRWFADRLHEQTAERHEDLKPLQRHIIVVGYGLNGQNVARVLASTGVAHVVMDEDADRVSAARRADSHALLADAADPSALRMAGVEAALAAIVAISDPHATRRIVRLCREMQRDIHIIVRTRYVAEVERLRLLGADEVIPEEFETSLEIVTRTLHVLCVPQNIVANQIRLLRDEGYRMLRDPAVRATDSRRLTAIFAGGTSQTYLVFPGAWCEGRSIQELGLEHDSVAVAALLRDGHALSPLPLHEPLQAGDTMLLVGGHEDLTRAVARLEHAGAASGL
ncbi:MAG TPA: cation:proton antiporter [Thermoanaerobaculia bacterium]|nr:cation:proton antiporter [Thermoanaerobaculia bacterium]